MATNTKKKRKQFAVLGLGRFGSEIAKSLFFNGCEVLAVDADEESTAAVVGYTTHTAVADVTDEATLRQLEITSFDTVIVSIGDNLQASIMCAFLCKDLGCPHIIAKARDEKHAKILEKIGVDEVIIPEADSAKKTATKLINPKISELMELADGYSIAEFKIPEEWSNKTLFDLKLPSKYQVNVLIILSKNKEFTMPSGDSVLDSTDMIVVGGMTQDIKRLGDAISRLTE